MLHNYHRATPGNPNRKCFSRKKYQPTPILPFFTVCCFRGLPFALPALARLSPSLPHHVRQRIII